MPIFCFIYSLSNSVGVIYFV